MLEGHRHLLLAHRAAIVQDLLVEDVLTELRSKFVISVDDNEVICAEKTSRQRAEKLLDLLPSKGYNAFQLFYESLLEKYSHLAALLAQGIEETDRPLQNIATDSMTVIHRDLLTVNRGCIVDDLLVDDILGELQSHFIFDDNDVELVRSEKTSRRQTEKLLDLLVTKGDHAFQHFLDALREGYPHLVELLENDGVSKTRAASVSADLQNVVESKLLEGGVPQRPLVYTSRPRQTHRLKTALTSLKDRDAWVVAHGMAGCGKTVLAIDALHSGTLFEECFPGGVFWLNIGPVDRSKLLMKMQNLCSRLDKDKHRPLPRNLEEARDRVKSLFSHQHPRALLVLDDLWSAHDARFFDIRARVLVTTRDVSIANRIEGAKCKVYVKPKLSNAQCMEILAQWTKKHITELPNEASHIIEECNGHPLAISMIGAMLRDHPARWVYYWSQLRNHKLSKLKTKFAYDYPSLSEAIAMSIENLNDDLRGKYLDFVLFDSSIQVPLQLFCLLWDMEKEEVEDVMDELNNKSLLKTSSSPDKTAGNNSNSLPGSFSGGDTGYAIHNLQQNYLLENCADIEVRHGRLVDSYRKACKGNFASLKDDGYIHFYLVHHLLESKQAETAIELLTNLTWVARKLEVAGPADILNDYIIVMKTVQEEQKGDFRRLDDFYHFVRTNAHMFVSRPIPDVVQAALIEPVDNEVYRQAKEQALKRSKQGTLYIDWCNKHEESSYSLEMTVKPHNGPISCCSFSSDGKTVISSSSDATAKIWEAVSGKVLHSLEDHQDVVTCCCFNQDNTKVLTTSHDCSVKIWKLGAHAQLTLTYNDHKQDVYCAAFSPTGGKEMISCSGDHTIRIWDSETGFTSAVCKGHSDVVRWCCFSRDGIKIASGSHDQTVKIWETSTGKCVVTTPKHNEFVSYCCFSKDGRLVFASSATYIKIWDSSTGEACGSLEIFYNVLAFAVSFTGDKMALALADATIQLWDISSKTQLTVYHGHKSWVHTVAFSADDSQLVSGSADETVKIWPVDTTAYTKRVKLKKIFDVFFDKDQLTIAVADSHNRLKVFRGCHVKETCATEAFSTRITCCVFSRDGSYVAIGLKSGEMKVLTVSTCQPAVIFSGHQSAVLSLSYNKFSTVLLSSSQDKSFMTWDAQTGRALLKKEQRHCDAVTTALFYDEETKIVTSSKDGTAKVWESTTGHLLFTCQHKNNEWVSVCSVTSDNKRLVTGAVDSEVKVWDAISGSEHFTISPHTDCVRSLVISGNNERFATGSDDGSVMISAVSDGRLIAECTPHVASWVTDVMFSKDSSQLVTIGNNIQWHKQDGSLLQQFSIKGSYLRHIKCSKDFTTFITIDNIGVLYILKVIS